jgi:Domain of unknown function (DUF4407)
MNKTYNDIRLFLFTCSGEDNFILKRCKGQIQRRFAILGFCVLLIFLGCFFSATFFTYSLFDGEAKWTSIPIGLIWGSIVVNMYLLLLHTISPAIIPLSSKKNKGKNATEVTQVQNKFLTLSMFLRMSFMVLLAIIIAQPLNVKLLSWSVESSIQKHKIKERVKLYSTTNKDLIKTELIAQKDLNKKIKNRLDIVSYTIVMSHLAIINDKIIQDSLFIIKTNKKLKQLAIVERKSFLALKEKTNKEIILVDLDTTLSNELQSDNDFIENIKAISINGSLHNDFEKFKANTTLLMNEKRSNYNALNGILNKSNFYVKTIQLLLSENPFSWIITFLVSLLFLFPIYFKYKIRDLSVEIFQKQEQNEPEIIKLREELINTKNFNWLEKKIKSTNIKNIRTSDYYFQRMLIEHKIILEEYDQTKKKFSQSLTANVKQYNRSSLKRILPLLEKLKQVNPNKYSEIKKQIFEEYVDEEMVKYEYWLDCPFRTKRVHSPDIANNESEFLDFIYNLEA